MTNFEKWKENLTIKQFAKICCTTCIQDICPLKEKGEPFWFGTFLCEKEAASSCSKDCYNNLIEWANKECVCNEKN